VQLRPDARWQAPVLLTQATDGTGVDDLLAAIDAHQAARTRRAAHEDEEARLQEWYEILRDELSLRLERAVAGEALRPMAERLRRGDIDPYSAALDTLADPAALERLLGERRDGGEE